MAKYAIVESGTVTKVIECDGSLIGPGSHPDSSSWILCNNDAQIGGTYDGSTFTAPTPPADTRTYAQKREGEYPSVADFMEAYTEKEIGSDSTKWDAYVIAYNKVRTDNPKS